LHFIWCFALILPFVFLIIHLFEQRKRKNTLKFGG
jgi:hypothetical protein